MKIINRFRQFSLPFILGVVLLSTSSFFRPVANEVVSAEQMLASRFFSLINPFIGVEPGMEAVSFVEAKADVFDSLQLETNGLSREAFSYAIQGVQNLIELGVPVNTNVLTIIDYSKSSATRRLYTIDLNNYQLLFHTWVSHGKNSGKEYATSFSNKMSSNKSSVGFFITDNTYRGKHGYSLRLRGLEKGINDNAHSRAIVMHAADYVNPSIADRRGYIGRSQGCPAVMPSLHKPIIQTIKDQTCIFIYHPDYVAKSILLN
jgi:hypothetical protein